MTLQISSLLTFGVIGLATTATHILIAIRLLEVSGLHPALANTAAFLVATTVGYVLNSYWSFRSRSSGRALLRYLTVTSFGAACCAALTSIAHARGVHPWLAIVATLMVVPLLTFILHQQWTFRRTDFLTPHNNQTTKAFNTICTILCVSAICAAVLVLHSATLQGHWRWDDGPNLLRATQYGLFETFTHPEVLRHASGNQLAPFNLAIYITNLTLFGTEPFWFYLQHLVMLSTAGIVFMLLLRLWLHPLAALTGTLLMLAGLPVSQMAQQLMVGHYILGLIFVCAMFLSYAKSLAAEKPWTAWTYSLLTAMFYALACLSKEIYVPAIIVLLFLPKNINNLPQTTQLRFAAPALLVAGAYTFIRWNLFAGVGGYHSGSFNSLTLSSVVNLGTTLLGTGLSGAMAFFLLISSMAASALANPLRRLPLLFALGVAVGVPIVILAGSQPDWGQHARYLFLPWVLICINWAIWLSPSKGTPRGMLLAKIAVALVFMITTAPAAQSRFTKDAHTHAMFDAYSRHAAGSDAAQPILPVLINAPGYLTAVLSAVNTVHQQSESINAQSPQVLNIIYPATLNEVPPETVAWQSSCYCLMPWSMISKENQSELIQQQHTSLLITLPVKAPWPPMADGIDGRIEALVRQGNQMEMSGWLPTTGIGSVLFLVGSSRSSIQNLELQLMPRGFAAEQDFVLRFTVPEARSELATSWCLISQSQRPGEAHRFQIIKWANKNSQINCDGLLSPAGRRMNQGHKIGVRPAPPWRLLG